MRSPVLFSARLWFSAALVGCTSAAAVMGFRALIDLVEFALTGHRGSLVAAARALAPWHRVATCVAGGLIAGLVLEYGQRWAAAGRGSAKHIDYIDAAREGTSELNDRTTLVRSVSSLFSVGSGASIGREGPMVQLTAWLATKLGRWLALPAAECNAILVCGIAAGIGTAYHAPAAGAVFALELALGYFARHAIAPVLIAASTACGLIYWLVEPHPLYVMPEVALQPVSIAAALVLGPICGGIGWSLLRLLELGRRAFAPIHSLPLRLALGGLLVGGLSAVLPEVWGNGYSVVSNVLQGQLAWNFVFVVLLAKVLATMISSGSGAIGGVFTPTLFVGATSGYVLAHAASNWIAPEYIGAPSLLAVIAMGAVLASVTQAPLMAIVMVLEMTGQFQLVVPVMLACGLAFAVSTQFGTRPLYGNPIEGAISPRKEQQIA
ncbi:MAG: chloride channel protein [Betaproteobacteria bacterium]|nr:chloride channel protein [Betaproteobacteria bacterium]